MCLFLLRILLLTICRLPPLHPVKLLPFDHILPNPSTITDAPSHTAFLYADMSSPNFRELHAELLALSTALPPRLTYIFRHVPPKHEGPVPREYLSGYGVGLDLKKTDYLVMDDRSAKRRGATIFIAFSSAADCFVDYEEHSSDATSGQVADHILDVILAQADPIDGIDLNTALTKHELSSSACFFARHFL